MVEKPASLRRGLRQIRLVEKAHLTQKVEKPASLRRGLRLKPCLVNLQEAEG